MKLTTHSIHLRAAIGLRSLLTGSKTRKTEQKLCDSIGSLAAFLAVRVSDTDLPDLRHLPSVFLSSSINDLLNYAKLKMVRWPVSISVESQTDSVDDVLNDVYLKD